MQSLRQIKPLLLIKVIFQKRLLNLENVFKFDYIASIRPSIRKALLLIPPEEFEIKPLLYGKKLGIKEFNDEKYETFIKKLEVKRITIKKKKYETCGKNRRKVAMYNPKQAK